MADRAHTHASTAALLALADAGGGSRLRAPLRPFMLRGLATAFAPARLRKTAPGALHAPPVCAVGCVADGLAMSGRRFGRDKEKQGGWLTHAKGTSGTPNEHQKEEHVDISVVEPMVVPR